MPQQENAHAGEKTFPCSRLAFSINCLRTAPGAEENAALQQNPSFFAGNCRPEHWLANHGYRPIWAK